MGDGREVAKAASRYWFDDVGVGGGDCHAAEELEGEFAVGVLGASERGGVGFRSVSSVLAASAASAKGADAASRIQPNPVRE
jgi:hypothetical protein